MVTNWTMNRKYPICSHTLLLLVLLQWCQIVSSRVTSTTKHFWIFYSSIHRLNSSFSRLPKSDELNHLVCSQWNTLMLNSLGCSFHSHVWFHPLLMYDFLSSASCPFLSSGPWSLRQGLCKSPPYCSPCLQMGVCRFLCSLESHFRALLPVVTRLLSFQCWQTPINWQGHLAPGLSRLCCPHIALELFLKPEKFLQVTPLNLNQNIPGQRED